MKIKNLTLVILFALVHMSFATSYAPNETLGSIDNGWYIAKVKHYNYSTGESGTYTLNVRVQYNAVKEIDFGNGGSVHDGYNNSDYTWSGGYLSFSSNYQGQVESASTNVTIYGSNGSMRTFDITIGG
jgi:hypothetical protein